MASPRNHTRIRWARRLGAGLGVGALVLSVTGLAARRVPPSTVWWPQSAALILPLAGSVAGLAGVAWGIRAVRGRRTLPAVLAVIHLTAAGAIFARSVGEVRVDETPDVDALRVMTLNAGNRRGAVPEGRAWFSDDEPHIIALQEVSIRRGDIAGTWLASGAGRSLLSAPGYGFAEPSNAGGHAADGLALFSRLPVVSSVSALLDTTSVVNAGKYTRAEVEWKGRRIAIYNVHFRSFLASRPWQRGGGVREWIKAIQDSGKDFISREEEARLFRRVLDADTLPFIVLGDFNATPDHWTYDRVARGLVDALDTVPGRASTYPDSRPLVRIDAVLASPHWGVRRAKVRPAGVSDHRAVTAHLTLLH